jgi:hypothetical protein
MKLCQSATLTFENEIVATAQWGSLICVQYALFDIPPDGG